MKKIFILVLISAGIVFAQNTARTVYLPTIAGTGTVTINDDGEDINYRFEAVSQDSALVIDGGTGLVFIEGGLTVGRSAAAAAGDVTFYSATVGDYFLWDASAKALTIIGTNGTDALNIDDGDVDIADNIDVDGLTTLDSLTTSQGVTVGTVLSVTTFGIEWSDYKLHTVVAGDSALGRVFLDAADTTFKMGTGSDLVSIVDAAP